MSQYVLSQNYGEYDLLYALETYEPMRLVLSAFSLGNRDINARSIEKSEIHNLEFTIGTQWRITVSNTFCYHHTR